MRGRSRLSTSATGSSARTEARLGPISAQIALARRSRVADEEGTPCLQPLFEARVRARTGRLVSKVLGDGAIENLEATLGDSGNFRVAKFLLMVARDAGLGLDSREDIEARHRGVAAIHPR